MAPPGEVLREIREAYGGTPRTNALQRATECVLAGVGLMVALPLMLGIALVIRLDSPGPVLFRQMRVGRGGRLFRFVKFRTFYADARERFPELYAYRYAPEEIEALTFKQVGDPRITRRGEWLRRTSLDELPNLWNVLIGDMALVGPRPEIPEMLPYYPEEHRVKFSARPGVTGLAQISGRGRLRFLETAELDTRYVLHRSFATDLRILARTVWLIARQDGAF